MPHHVQVWISELNFNENFADQRYGAGNGNQAKQVGTLKSYTNDSGSSWDIMVANGAYTFISPEGNRYIVHYIADENGYVETSRTETATQPGDIDDDYLYDQALFPINGVPYVGK